MRGCSTHYHETLGLTDSVDMNLIDPPSMILRDYTEKVDELESSIREKGLIQPIIVRPVGMRYQVVAGARRLEACKRLRWSRVPCIIRELTDRDAYEIALTENVQRKTMNPVEEATAFRRYIDEYGWGGETVLSKKIGKSQEYVSQRLSLLSLPNQVVEKIIRRQITASVAQEITKLPDRRMQIALSEKAARERMTVELVRKTTQLVKSGDTLETAVESAKVQIISRSYVEKGIRLNGDIDSWPMKLADDGEDGPPDVRQLDNAVLIMKLALSRLSTLIDRLPQDSDVREMLTERWHMLHGMVDSLIKAKIKMRRVPAKPLQTRRPNRGT